MKAAAGNDKKRLSGCFSTGGETRFTITEEVVKAAAGRNTGKEVMALASRPAGRRDHYY